MRHCRFDSLTLPSKKMARHGGKARPLVLYQRLCCEITEHEVRGITNTSDGKRRRAKTRIGELLCGFGG